MSPSCWSMQTWLLVLWNIKKKALSGNSHAYQDQASTSTARLRNPHNTDCHLLPMSISLPPWYPLNPTAHTCSFSGSIWIRTPTTHKATLEAMSQLFCRCCLRVMTLSFSILICQHGQHILSLPLQSSRATENTTTESTNKCIKFCWDVSLCV